MEVKGINKQFDEMWFRTHGKKHQNALVQKEKSPLREYSSALIIQRFLAKARLERSSKSRRTSKSVIFDGSTKLKHPSMSQRPLQQQQSHEGDEYVAPTVVVVDDGGPGMVVDGQVVCNTSSS
jgi:hypothetical protein